MKRLLAMFVSGLMLKGEVASIKTPSGSEVRVAVPSEWSRRLGGVFPGSVAVFISSDTRNSLIVSEHSHDSEAEAGVRQRAEELLGRGEKRPCQAVGKLRCLETVWVGKAATLPSISLVRVLYRADARSILKVTYGLISQPGDAAVNQQAFEAEAARVLNTLSVTSGLRI